MLSPFETAVVVLLVIALVVMCCLLALIALNTRPTNEQKEYHENFVKNIDSVVDV